MHRPETGGEIRRPHAGGELSVVAWNIERGRRIDLWAGHPAVAGADVLLLSEVDRDLARSGRLHVARELAERLGLEFAWVPAYRELTHGNALERIAALGAGAVRGHQGVSVLSRLPISRARAAVLPRCHDWSRAFERREGDRVALVCELEHASGPLSVVSTHLENRADPAGRARQFEALLAALPDGRCVIGGDLNCALVDFSHKWTFVTVLLRTLRERALLVDPVDEEPLFALAASKGFDWREANVAGVGTGVPPWIRVPAFLRPKVDWILARGLRAVAGSARVYACPRTWQRLSEHEGVGVRLHLDPAPAAT